MCPTLFQRDRKSIEGMLSSKNKIKCKNVLKAVENHWKTSKSMGNAWTWLTYILEYCSK
jgi:hypothetical protein